VSVLRLLLANVAYCLTCLDRAVLEHTFWAMATFPVCFLSLALEQIELTRVQNDAVGLKNIYIILKKQYNLCKMIILCQADFQEQIEKIVTVYHRELLKERPSIGTFCTQSVFQGINGNTTLNFFFPPRTKAWENHGELEVCLAFWCHFNNGTHGCTNCKTSV
jgi:hypothetical protein